MHSPNIFALHGFLGSHQDWKMFDIITNPLEIEQETLDFWAWSHAFNTKNTKSNGKNILLGYSLGGRLAMHALLSNPSLWDAAIFISAHPGLTSPTERSARLKNDQRWAQRFLEDPWYILMRDWNNQAVFGGRLPPFPRIESEVDRIKLSRQLTNWSLGNQEPLLNRVSKLSMPLLILAGEHDTTFCSLAEQFEKFATVSIIPNAAHRVPWEQPEKFMSEVQKFCHANSLSLIPTSL